MFLMIQAHVKILGLLLVFAVVSFSSLAYSQFKLGDLEPKESYSKFGVQLDSDQIDRAIEQYIEKLPDVLVESRQSLTLFKEAGQFAQARYEEIKKSTNNNIEAADELFKEEIDQKKIIYNNEQLGTAEFTRIDNSVVIRMIDKVGTAILFIHAQYVSKDSNHLKQYISRQNAIAGNIGRNLIVIWHDDNEVLSTENYLKPSKWSLSYWQGYFRAVHKPATFDSLCFGIVSGLAQAAMTGIMGYIQSGVTPQVAILVASVFGFGSVIGTYASTYRNVVFYSASKLNQILKQSVVSFAFAYMVFSINQAALGDPSHITSFSEYVSLLFNIFLSSAAKNEFSQWAKIKDMERVDLKEHSIKVPFLDRAVTFSERDVNYQIKVQLTTQGIRTADLLGYQFTIPTSEGIYTIELGKVLLWLSAPIVHFSVKNWALKNYPEAAKHLGLDISFKEAVKGFLERFIKHFTELNPLIWKSILTKTVINESTEAITTEYFKALSRSIEQNNKATDRNNMIINLDNKIKLLPISEGSLKTLNLKTLRCSELF
jgi:hypothetical protein